MRRNQTKIPTAEFRMHKHNYVKEKEDDDLDKDSQILSPDDSKWDDDFGNLDGFVVIKKPSIDLINSNKERIKKED